MVLQQNSSVKLWGTAKPGRKVQIKSSWQKEILTTTVLRDSTWKVLINTPAASGPHNLEISDGTPVKISNVLIGEVWLCSGQSNMTMPVKGFPNDPVEGSTEEILHAKNKSIRFFDVGRSSKLGLQKDVKGAWKVVNPENLSNFSATAWFFGKTVQQNLDVPVGLITSSWGGSNIETWMSKEALSAFKDIKIPSDNDSVKIPNQTPTVLFNNMIYPIIGYGIKGMIWYQGESNRLKPGRYMELLPAMVKDWRSLWGTNEFPFYYLQIAPFNYRTGLSSAYIREAQLKAQKLIPNSGIGFLTDAGQENNIHPSNKKAAGMRLACLALVKSYGLKGLPETGPIYKSMQVKDTTAHLTFEHAEGGLTSWGKVLDQFEIAGEDRIFYPAKAVITKQGVAVSNADKIKIPVAVRYAFKDFVIGDLFNNAGFPASSFRTDDWPNVNKATGKLDVDKELNYCMQQAEKTLKIIPANTLIPRMITGDSGEWKMVPAGDWTSGFWPGILWYIYEYSKDEKWKVQARKYTGYLRGLSSKPAFDHDLGFQVFCSFGNGYRLTGDSSYRKIIHRTSDTLATLFNPRIGTILSWPFRVKELDGHNTIIDNMMNLEMLLWASKDRKEPRLGKIALKHAEVTMKNHFRPDYSAYHVVVYDEDGKKKRGITYQGQDDESMWARGQAWAIYGYTMMYRETGDPVFLDFAQKVTDVYLRRLPDDLIPYWDFDAPNIPNDTRDASAAAITASALLDLAEMLPESKGRIYRQKAEQMLISLSAEAYQSRDRNTAFLMHSRGSRDHEKDISITYADYYYLEALLKFKKLLRGQMIAPSKS